MMIVFKTLMELTVAELKMELKLRKLPMSGVKKILIERLKQALPAEGKNSDSFYFKFEVVKTQKEMPKEDEPEEPEKEDMYLENIGQIEQSIENQWESSNEIETSLIKMEDETPETIDIQSPINDSDQYQQTFPRNSESGKLRNTRYKKAYDRYNNSWENRSQKQGGGF
jgi:hypothetical protein